MAQIYGDLPYDEVPGGITVATAFQCLKEILELVDNQLVRERALRSAIGLSRDHFAQMQAIVPTVTSEEMAQIVDKLTEIYLDQRAKLGGGERRWYHKGTGRYYPIWLSNQPRPLTDIENEMLEWIRNDRNVVAQQIGVRALAAFVREFDLAEARHVTSLRRAQQSRQRIELPEVLEWRRSRVGLYSRSLYHWYIIPWLVAPLSRRYRSIIRGVLPEVLLQYHTSYDIVQFLLEDWQLLIDKEFPIISRHLERAIFWDSYLGRWLLGGSLLPPGYIVTHFISMSSPVVSGYLTWLLLVLVVVWLGGDLFLWWKYARRR
ncbi:hypothetical protein EKD04_006175 [Chloroflexales bacterium ZM16-3]|nr:hypothetical protein [Chloroflexales bacterium ZM16-3]